MVVDSHQTTQLPSSEPTPDTFIPLARLALCNNDHAYSAMRFSACPSCGSYERVMVETLLSPAILSGRLHAALRWR